MMRNLMLTLLTLSILGVVAFAQSKQSYRLGWPHTQVMRPATTRPSVEAPVERSQLPAPTPEQQRTLEYPEVRSQTQPTLPRKAPGNVAVVTRHFFDFEKDCYVLVDRVVTTVYRGQRYPHTQTHWNMGHNSEFEVNLDNLRQGDRYEVEVFWEDDSSKRLEHRIDPTSRAQVLVDEPDAFTR